MTGQQGMLFTEPQPEQLDLFGPDAAPDGGGVPPSAEAEQAARITRQRDRYIARANEVRAHCDSCDKCVPGGRRCREGRRLEQEQRISGDALSMLIRGEL